MVPHTESEAWDICAWKLLLWGWWGGGDAHFWMGFPELEEYLEVEGGPEGPFWPRVGYTGAFLLEIKVLLLLLNILLGSSLFMKE